jgi:hypothetical protein
MPAKRLEHQLGQSVWRPDYLGDNARQFIDQRIMRDAPLVPLIWENFSFQWASRGHGWVYNPWTLGPDLTAVWLDPQSP